MTNSIPERASWGQTLKRAAKPLIAIVVILGIGQSVRLAWLDLHSTHVRTERRLMSLNEQLTTASNDEQKAIHQEILALENSQFQLKHVRWKTASIAIPFAILGLVPPAVFWWLTLRSFGHSVPIVAAQTAFATGNLGKYVPGKAMVLILRSGAMQRFGVPISTSIVSIFIETLTSLAVGGALGAITLSALNPPRWLLGMAIGVAAISLAPTIPPLFRRILESLTRYRHLRIPKKLPHAMNWRLVGSGWCLFFLAWLLMGTSLWVLCESIRDSMTIESSLVSTPSVSSLRLWWISISAACLGFVIGFLSMLPGGAGVREVVVTMLLAPAIGYAPALAAAVLYRIANLIAELMMAGFTWLLAKRSARHETRDLLGTAK
ncbi:MAG: lysylphosphatidylglycerol synthase transmembrane domain-containing protein [Pirellulaceae bacterium]|nr:lysylphosphatidylglycerol synthase transmembrane domain-containing protein [Pirellulaceae bacterium]